MQPNLVDLTLFTSLLIQRLFSIHKKCLKYYIFVTRCLLNIMSKVMICRYVKRFKLIRPIFLSPSTIRVNEIQLYFILKYIERVELGVCWGASSKRSPSSGTNWRHSYKNPSTEKNSRLKRPRSNSSKSKLYIQIIWNQRSGHIGST